MKIFMVGGTFDDTHGKPSKLVSTIARQIKSRGHTTALANGGNVDDLSQMFDVIGAFDAVLWFPNVPNNYGKNVGMIKAKYPKVLLVTSKRNDDAKYVFMDLLNHALSLKANLTLEFYKFGNRYQGCVFDPLGCVWGRSEDFVRLTDMLVGRLEQLAAFTRVPSYMNGNYVFVPGTGELPEFFELVKERAETFHDLVHPAEGVTRFLGNVSFRCERGFPSFKHSDGTVYMSRRNVDKRYIGSDAFVRVELDDDGHVGYYGPQKPSVDAPVQLRLYERYPKARYMLHAHVYIKDAPFTEKAIPCGAIEEFDEIEAATDKWEDYWTPPCNFALNLIGHGSIVIADSLDYLRSVQYYARDVPEVTYTEDK